MTEVIGKKCHKRRKLNYQVKEKANKSTCYLTRVVYLLLLKQKVESSKVSENGWWGAYGHKSYPRLGSWIHRMNGEEAGAQRKKGKPLYLPHDI